MRDFRQLRVWQRAHRLAVAVHHASAAFPPHELYGLRSQLCRAAASIAGNLSEGCGHESQRQFARFVKDARASSSEVENHLLLARDLGYLDPADHLRLEEATREVRRMLTALLKRIEHPPHLPAER